MSKLEKQESLSDIVSEYADRLHMNLDLGEQSITTTSFYKTTVQRLKDMLSSFDIDIKNFLSDNKKSYFFNDSKEEIITMLDYYDNSIVKKVRLKKNVDYISLISDEQIHDKIKEFTKFAKALKSFMDKNGYNLPKKVSEYESKEEFNEDLFENIDKINVYDSNNAKLNIDRQIKIEIFEILVEIIEYVQATDIFWAMNEQFVLDKLKVFKRDLQSCLNKYKIHWDCLYRDDVCDDISNFDYEYEPFPFVEYNPKKT